MTATAYDVISPVDESVVESVPFADAAAVDARVERAHRAFAGWRAVAVIVPWNFPMPVAG